MFDEQSKQEISHCYHTIGIITSSTGAAIHDVISVIRRRYPLQKLIIYPCLVQGNQAADQIINQIILANQRNEVELLLLVRGGGSMEDLWCFNSELLARTIHHSCLPIVTGIGHEVDFTIADYVADLRAPTPSAAAERTTQDQREVSEHLNALTVWQISFIELKLQNLSQKLDWLQRQLQSPERLIKNREQQLELLKQRMVTCVQQKLNQSQNLLHTSHLKLSHLDPGALIQTAIERHLQLKTRLIQAIEKNLSASVNRFREFSLLLDSLSPLATLGRGYSLTKTADGTLVKDVTQIKIGDTIFSTLKNASLESQVTKATQLNADTTVPVPPQDALINT